MPTLKQRTIVALIWNAIQNYGTLAVSFIANLVLIRLLTPTDFGAVGILTIFVALANTVIDGGFSSALIQKKNLSLDDTYTVFIWNVSFSIFLIILLFLSARAIGKYFSLPELTPLLRVESMLLLFNSLSAVQTALLTKELNFKALALRRLIGVCIGTGAAIILAYNGFGVWSLVARDVLGGFIGCTLLWFFSTWRPILIFNWASFKGLFKFGSYIFLSSILYTLYQNIQGLIIGKAYSIAELGYYSQARKLQEIPISGSSSIISSVMFPVFASVAEDRAYHRNLVRRNMRIISFLFSPIIIFLICIAKPLIIILFTSKWEASILLFQILCVNGLFFPLNASNTEIFKAIGRSDVYLTMQTIKQLTCIVVIILFIPLGIVALMWGIALTGLISYCYNLYFTQRYFGYNWKAQIKDIIPSIILSVGIAGCLYLLFDYIKLECDNIILILIWCLSFFIGYGSLSTVFNCKALYDFKNLFKNK